MKAGAELDQRRHPAVHFHGAARRLADPGHQLQQRALAGSVPADHAERPALWNRQRDIVQCGERLVRSEIPDQAARQKRAFQRRELLTMAEPAVKLRGAIDLDREGRGARGDERGAGGEGRRAKSLALVCGASLVGRVSRRPPRSSLITLRLSRPALRPSPLAPRSSHFLRKRVTQAVEDPVAEQKPPD